MKGVEIGLGFEAARRRGSRCSRSVCLRAMWRTTHLRKRTRNNAGGLEGGVTNGEPLVCRVAMKPISTLMKALAQRQHRRPAKRRRRTSSAAIIARFRRRAWSAKRWSRLFWPMRCWKNSAATRWKKSAKRSAPSRIYARHREQMGGEIRWICSCLRDASHSSKAHLTCEHGKPAPRTTQTVKGT